MINWGMIGCGSVTELKSGPAFSKVKESKLIAVMRRDPDLVKDYASRHNVPKYYTNAGKLINDPDVNAVYVATPPGSHAGYAIMSLEAGKPVYIEKPMAIDHAECMKINRKAEKCGLPVFVAYYRRTLPGFLKIKDLIEKGSIGKVRFVSIELLKHSSDNEKSGLLPWRVKPKESGGGHFFDLASHQLDYLDFLFGPIKSTRSIVLNQAGFYEAEDLVSASFELPGNIAATGIWSFSVAPCATRDTIEIIGEEGFIKTSTFSFEPIVLVNGNGRQEFVNERPENVQFYLIEQIVNALHGRGNVVSTGISGARTSKVMDEVVKEYYNSKK